MESCKKICNQILSNKSNFIYFIRDIHQSPLTSSIDILTSSRNIETNYARSNSSRKKSIHLQIFESKPRNLLYPKQTKKNINNFSQNDLKNK